MSNNRAIRPRKVVVLSGDPARADGHRASGDGRAGAERDDVAPGHPPADHRCGGAFEHAQRGGGLLPRRVGRHDGDEPRGGGGHQEPLDAERVGTEHDDDVGAVRLRHRREQRLDRPQAHEAERGGIAGGELDPRGGQPRRVRLQPVEQGPLTTGVLRLPTGGGERRRRRRRRPARRAAAGPGRRPRARRSAPGWGRRRRGHQPSGPADGPRRRWPPCSA